MAAADPIQVGNWGTDFFFFFQPHLLSSIDFCLAVWTSVGMNKLAELSRFDS